LGEHKFSIRNKSRQEASIAEAHITKECVAFCTRYLQGIAKRQNRPSRNYEDGDEAYRDLSAFSIT